MAFTVTSAASSVGTTVRQSARVTLTNSQIKHVRATPIELVAAPGSGKIIQFLGATLFLHAGVNAITESDDNLVIRYTGTSGVAVSVAIEATGFIDQTANTMTCAIPIKDTIVATGGCVNQNLVLHNTGDGEYGGNVAADATLDVTVWYTIATTV